MAVRDREWWLNEARMSAEDGHPETAVCAMANALVGEQMADDPGTFRRLCPAEWAQLEVYAEAMGVELPA